MEGIKDEVELKCLSVLCGDAIIIRFLGADGIHHNMLIDGGFSKTYQTVLKPAISEIVLNSETIDLLILSHYDLDHIGGIIQLVNDKSVDLHQLVTRWWLNIDIPLTNPGGPITIQQLLTLKAALQQKNIEHHSPIIVSETPFDLFGASIRVLSPDEFRYNAAQELIEQQSAAIARSGNDYQHRVEYFESTVLREPKQDDQPSNGSSIAILFTLDGKKVLLMADAFPSVISASIRALGYDDKDNPLILQSVKLSHHGSKANISNEFLKLIRTTKFIISANATNTHNLPNKETIVRILLNSIRDEETYFDFYFTHKNNELENMFLVDGPDIYSRWRFRMHFPDAGETSILVN